MNITTGSKRKIAVLAAAMAAAAILAACGGSNNHGTPIAGGPGQSDPVDAFFALVQGQVSLAAETTTEPVSIDNVTATTNEDKEPVALP
ncbi:MAG: hypothetical protein JWP59_1409 [Massilia sp.]|jgi:ABC-type glycerol-3-phosphate transport system substrate-binding protein|nr:hypothetical protein [Massilia sp.]